MFRRIYRQRRRLCLSALFLGLGLYLTLLQAPDLYILPSTLANIGLFILASAAVALFYAAAGAALVVVFPDGRGLIEMLALTTFAHAALIVTLRQHLGADLTGPAPTVAWFALYGVIYSLIYGAALDRFRLWLGYRARVSFTFPLPPAALWPLLLPGQGAQLHFDPLMTMAETDPDDPQTSHITYSHGPGVVERQMLTCLSLNAPHQARYYFQGEANPRTGSLPEGTFSLTLTPAGMGSKVTLTEHRPTLLLREALRLWLDDRLGDRTDSLLATHRGLRDWSLSARNRRAALAIA